MPSDIYYAITASGNYLDPHPVVSTGYILGRFKTLKKAEAVAEEHQEGWLAHDREDVERGRFRSSKGKLTAVVKGPNQRGSFMFALDGPFKVVRDFGYFDYDDEGSGYVKNPSHPLLDPKEGPGRDLWDHLWKIGRSEFKTMDRTWDPAYDDDVKQALSTQIQRLIESMREDDSQRLRDIQKDGHLKLMRLPFEDVNQRGDFRYDSADLAAVIEAGADLVPISVGARGEDGPYWVLDGHHRLRAYGIAGDPALALVAWTEPMAGEQAQFHIDLVEDL